MEDDNNNLYARWISDDISNEELEELKRSGVLAELQSIVSATEELSLKYYDKDFAYKRIVENRQKKNRVVEFISFRKIVAIAALFIGVVSMFLLLRSGSDVVVHGASFGDIAQVVLPDQSIITLNDGSIITYDSEKYSQDRVVRLKGEALFEVESGKSFKVQTDMGTIEVLGTIFNVQQWGENIMVECYEGSVKVTVHDSFVILKVGQSTTLQENGNLHISAIGHNQPFWQVGISKFDSVPVNLVFEEMARQFDVEIICKIENKIFSGAFTHNSLDNALREICLPMNLSYQIDQDKKRVTIE